MTKNSKQTKQNENPTPNPNLHFPACNISMVQILTDSNSCSQHRCGAESGAALWMTYSRLTQHVRFHKGTGEGILFRVSYMVMETGFYAAGSTAPFCHIAYFLKKMRKTLLFGWAVQLLGFAEDLWIIFAAVSPLLTPVSNLTPSIPLFSQQSLPSSTRSHQCRSLQQPGSA